MAFTLGSVSGHLTQEDQTVLMIHYRHRKPIQQYTDSLHAHLYFQRFFES